MPDAEAKRFNRTTSQLFNRNAGGERRLMATAPSWPRTVRKAKAAAYIDCAVATFDKMVAAGDMPPPFDLFGAPAWDVRDLDAAVDAIKAGANTRSTWKERAPARA